MAKIYAASRLPLTMKTFFKTLVNMVYPDPNHKDEPWTVSDWIVGFVLMILLGLLIGFLPEFPKW